MTTSSRDPLVIPAGSANLPLSLFLRIAVARPMPHCARLATVLDLVLQGLSNAGVDLGTWKPSYTVFALTLQASRRYTGRARTHDLGHQRAHEQPSTFKLRIAFKVLGDCDCHHL